MNKIYKNDGKYILKNNIPQILLSTLVLIFLSIFLKYLSISERSSSYIKKFQIIKLIAYFIFGFLLMIIFWFYITTFCVIYSKAQKVLIINSLISFIISMIFPFVYTLIPGLLRIRSLKVENHCHEYMYKISRIIAVI